jgi:hypothetical protein
VISARTTIATSALLPKNALMAASVVTRRREALFSPKIDNRGATVSTLATMRDGRATSNAFNVTFL